MSRQISLRSPPACTQTSGAVPPTLIHFMSQPYQKTRSKFSGIPLEPSKGDSIGISLRLGLSNSNFIGIPLRLQQWDSSRVPLLQNRRPSIRSSARHGLVTHDVASSKRILNDKKTNMPRVNTKNAKATQRKLWNHVWAGTPWQFSKNTFDDKSKPSEPMSPPTSGGCRDGADRRAALWNGSRTANCEPFASWA